MHERNGENIIGTVYCKRQAKQSLESKKMKNNGNELYVEWKDYDNSFNSWIHKNDIK